MTLMNNFDSFVFIISVPAGLNQYRPRAEDVSNWNVLRIMIKIILPEIHVTRYMYISVT